MTDQSIVSQLPLWPIAHLPPKKLLKPRDLQQLWRTPECLPTFMTDSPVAMRYLELLGPVAWPGYSRAGPPLTPALSNPSPHHFRRG